jgi:hypothetical protein
MAYRELGMIEIREIIRRWMGGDGVRAIARGARVDRKTVVRYVAAAQAIGVVRGGPPVTDEQLTAVRRLATPMREPALSDEMQSRRRRDARRRQRTPMRPRGRRGRWRDPAGS